MRGGAGEGVERWGGSSGLWDEQVREEGLSTPDVADLVDRPRSVSGFRSRGAVPRTLGAGIGLRRDQDRDAGARRDYSLQERGGRRTGTLGHLSRVQHGAP